MWDYDYQAGPAGSLTDLSDLCTYVRVVAEWSTGRRGSNPIVQYRHGEYASPRKMVRATPVMLETGIRYTDAAGAVTHTDGKAGHVEENFDALKQLFGGGAGELVRLQRTAPNQGTVYLDVEQLADALPSQSRSIIAWPLLAPAPFWVGAADTGNTGATLTPAGSAPVGDAVVKILTGTDTKLVVDSTGDFIQIEGAVPAGGVAVDVGADTALRITGGADWSGHLRMSTAFELNPGANAVTLSGGTYSADWFTKWR